MINVLPKDQRALHQQRATILNAEQVVNRFRLAVQMRIERENQRRLEAEQNAQQQQEKQQKRLARIAEQERWNRLTPEEKRAETRAKAAATRERKRQERLNNERAIDDNAENNLEVQNNVEIVNTDEEEMDQVFNDVLSLILNDNEAEVANEAKVVDEQQQQQPPPQLTNSRGRVTRYPLCQCGLNCNYKFERHDPKRSCRGENCNHDMLLEHIQLTHN